ncbi:MAG: hypothetical protein V3T72_08080 [Thermoanaerobaculia bacterium]
MTATLEAIVTLQKTLTELKAATERLDSIPDWMQELHQEHSERKEVIEQVEAESSAAEQQRRSAEAEASDAQELLARYQKQLGAVSTQREYGALLTEIDSAKGQIRNAEQRALEALESHEQAKQKLADLEDGFRELDERYQSELDKWEEEKPAVESSIEELRGRSEKLRAKVPRNHLLLFERIYDRYHGRALARVRETTVVRGNTMWHCESCSYNVRPQIVVEVRTRLKLNQCDSCKRILFWEDDRVGR